MLEDDVCPLLKFHQEWTFAGLSSRDTKKIKAFLMLWLGHGGLEHIHLRKAVGYPKVGTTFSPVKIFHIPGHVPLAEAGPRDRVSMSTLQMTFTP